MLVGLGKLGSTDIASSISQAIARMEGFYVSGSIAQRNNNPGNLRSGVGQSGSSGGYAVFPDEATGWAALQSQVQLNIGRGLNLYQFFGGGLGYPGYAPSADSNDPTHYADFVASVTGIDPNVPLNTLTGGDIPVDSGGDIPDDSTDSGPSTGAIVAVVAVVGLVLFGRGL